MDCQGHTPPRKPKRHFRCKAIEIIKEVKDDPPQPRDDDEAPHRSRGLR